MSNITNYPGNANRAAMRYHLIAIRMAIIKTQETASVGKAVEKRNPTYTAGGNAKNQCNHLWKTNMKILQKLRLELPYDPAILFLDIYLKK